MRDEKGIIETSIAREAHQSPHLKSLAEKGLIDFLRQQIVDAEWDIARAKALIDAYNRAIEAIEKRNASDQPI